MRSGIFIFMLMMISVHLYSQAETILKDNEFANVQASVFPITKVAEAINTGIPVLASEPGDIRFPNAFMWNHTGPTGGYWTESQINDFVFRPVFLNVAAYKLQIFNRAGAQIYESTDLQKGWDGYLQNGNLAQQGVYIWKAKGKYIDGSPFSKIGDVTFLH